jgi:hypothetical protein
MLFVVALPFAFFVFFVVQSADLIFLGRETVECGSSPICDLRSAIAARTGANA